MTPDSSRRAGLHSSIVLSAYLEPLIRGKRVAVLGDATLGLAEELLKRGARLVHAYDPEAARAAEAIAKAAPGRSPAVSFAVLAGDLGVRDGAFDAVVVPDLALFTDPAEILRKTRRLVAAAGAAVIASPNGRTDGRRLLPETGPARAPLGYYELYDLVSLQFAKVRMVGQAPFVGYTIADFAANDEPEVSVDTSLLASSEEPEHFIALAGDRPVALEAYTVVELPWTEVAGAQGAPGISAAEVEEERLALTEARTRLALVNVELEKLRDKQQSDAREVEGKAAAATVLSARVVELELAGEAQATRARELEARAGDNHVRAERAGHQIRDLEEELRRQRDRGTRLAKQLDEEKKSRTKAEVELGMLRGLAATPEPPATPTPRSVTSEDRGGDLTTARVRSESLERELDAARARISELEQDHVETQRRVPVQPAPDLLLPQRIAGLEAALNAALGEAADAVAARDKAVEHARFCETKSEIQAEELAAKLAALEGKLAEAERTIAALTLAVAEGNARAAEAQGRAAGLERDLAGAKARATEVQEKAVGLERDLAGAKARAAELDKKLNEGRAELTKKLSEGRAELTALSAKLTEAERRPGTLEAKLAEAERRAAELEGAKVVADAAAAEVAALEALLLDRGRAFAALERDVREGQRIGKELIAELTFTNGAALAAPPSDVDELRAQLDRLAASAARAEADLQAAGWRVAQLERQLADASFGPREATEVEAELEAALAAARDEVASLRRSAS